MRFLIFSDIHSNLEGFRALLSRIRNRKIDAYLFLGDIIGYGANPNEVIELLSSLPNLTTVMGNHDKAVLGLGSHEFFNPIASSALNWTEKRLNKFSVEFLSSMKRGPVRLKNGVCLCHGSPEDEDYYIFTPEDAYDSIEFSGERICFFGHTHVPVVYEFRGEARYSVYYPLDEGRSTIRLKPSFKYMINPGSIGQPRDKNPRATFLIYDDRRGIVKFYRINYNIRKARKKILNAGLPEILGDRLLDGY